MWPDGKLCAVSLAPMMVICAASNTAAGRGSGTATLKPRLMAPASSGPIDGASAVTSKADAVVDAVNADAEANLLVAADRDIQESHVLYLDDEQWNSFIKSLDEPMPTKMVELLESEPIWK